MAVLWMKGYLPNHLSSLLEIYFLKVLNAIDRKPKACVLRFLTKEIFYSRLFAILANTPSFLNEIGLSVVFWSNSRTIHVLLSNNRQLRLSAAQFPALLEWTNVRVPNTANTRLTHNACHGNTVPGLLVNTRVVDGPTIRWWFWSIQPDFPLQWKTSRCQ